MVNLQEVHFTKTEMEDESLFQVGETVEFWRVLVHLSVLALCLVLFEKALHRLERNFLRPTNISTCSRKYTANS